MGNPKKYFSGVGSRRAPADILTLIGKVGQFLAQEGFTLRSGHAQGCDRAFEEAANGEAIIYLPWDNFGQAPFMDDPGRPVLGEAICEKALWLSNFEWLVKEKIYFPNAKRSLRLLHGRNYAQVMGHTPECPRSKFLVCWAEEVRGEAQGGSATAVKIAQYYNIPVFNLSKPDDRKRIEDKVL